jgi:hypothetical protein
MGYVTTQAEFMRLQDSAPLSRVVFPNESELKPCHPELALGSRGSCISQDSLCAVIKEGSIFASKSEVTRHN